MPSIENDLRRSFDVLLGNWREYEERLGMVSDPPNERDIEDLQRLWKSVKTASADLKQLLPVSDES